MAINLTLGIEEQYKPLINALCSLPYFANKNITKVAVISEGLSQPCFRVLAENNEYFAKHLTSGNAEISANQLATQYGIAPKLIYGEGEWLITEFIPGELLQHCNISEDEKLAVLLSLLVKCHRLPVAETKTNVKTNKIETPQVTNVIPQLAIEQTISQLFEDLSLQQQSADSRYLSLAQQNRLQAIADVLLQELAQLKAGQSNDVFCHGDANFSNVIKKENSKKNTDNTRYQLIDFECACIAPIEYELAMLMAVNEIQSSKTEQIIALYCQLSSRPHSSNTLQQSRLTNKENKTINTAENSMEIVDNLTVCIVDSGNINSVAVTRYEFLSFIINGLWYLIQFHQHQQEKYKKLANNQFLLLTERYPETSIVIK